MSKTYSDKDYIRDVTKARREAVEFFSPRSKQERELWVARAFLRQIGVRFAEDDVIASTEEPCDVLFHDACIQVKELLDHGRRRGQEYKDALTKAEQTIDPIELSEQCEWRPIRFSVNVSDWTRYI